MHSTSVAFAPPPLLHLPYPACAQGVQFHPESIITDGGKRIVKNWIDSLQG